MSEPIQIEGEGRDLTLWDISGALPSLVRELEDAEAILSVFDDNPPRDDSRAGDLRIACADAVTLAENNLEAYLAQTVRAVDPIAKYIRNCEYKAEAADKELNRVRLVRDGWRRRAETVKAGTLAILKSMGEKRVESAINRLRRHGSGPSVEVTDAAAIPSKYVRVTVQMSQAQFKYLCDSEGTLGLIGVTVKEREVMLSDIAAALKAKIEVPGAKLVTDKEHLRVE